MTLNSATQALHDFLRRLTNLERYIKEPFFIDFFNSLSETHKNSILDLIKSYDYEKLKIFVKNMRAKKIDSMNIRDLRLLSSQYKIYCYGSLKRDELRKALHDVIKEKDDEC